MITLYCFRQFMNIIELCKIMASCQRAIKICSYKPDGNVCVSRCKQNGGGALSQYSTVLVINIFALCTNTS